MNETVNRLNSEYKALADELFEEILCDKCMKPIKIGSAEGKLVNNLSNETLFLCRKCNGDVRKLIKKI